MALMSLPRFAVATKRILPSGWTRTFFPLLLFRSGKSVVVFPVPPNVVSGEGRLAGVVAGGYDLVVRLNDDSIAVATLVTKGRARQAVCRKSSIQRPVAVETRYGGLVGVSKRESGGHDLAVRLERNAR